MKFGLRKGLGSSAGPMLEKVGLAANPDLTAFFGLHDGMTLFCCAKTGKHPVEIFTLKSMPAKTRAMQRWIKADDFPELETPEDPYGLRTAIAIGGSPNSSSYLAITVQGPFVGSVFQVDHGAPPDGPLASSFYELLNFAAERPVEFLRDAAAYPRYSDGTSAILWEPIDFSATGDFTVS